MDGRITALRVGFLSSSHQLAGLNFLLPALLKTIQGLYPFIGIFGIVLTACCWLVVWQVCLWSWGSFFPSSCLKRVQAGELEVQKLAPQ